MEDWTDAIVKITAHGDQGRTGTGFFVAPDLVMTALHVVCKGYDRHPPPTQPVKADVDGYAATMVWPPLLDVQGSVDIALLQLDKPTALPAQALGLARTWVTRAKFHSAGYPRSLRSGKRVEAEGTTAALQPDRRSAYVSSRTGPNQHEFAEDWHGMSGAPIVCRGLVIGVVSHQEPAWRQQLDAIPTDVLADADAFWDHIPAPDRTAELRQALLDTLTREAVYETLRTNADASADQVLDQLLDGDCREHIRRIKACFDHALKDGSKPRCSALFDAARGLVTLRSPVVAKGQDGVYRVHAVSPSGTAIAAARAEGYIVTFEPPKKDRDNPPGRGAIPAHPEKTLGGDVSAAKRFAARHLADALGLSADLDLAILAEQAHAWRDEGSDATHFYFDLSKDAMDRLQGVTGELSKAVEPLNLYHMEPDLGSYETHLVKTLVLMMIRLSQLEDK